MNTSTYDRLKVMAPKHPEWCATDFAKALDVSRERIRQLMPRLEAETGHRVRQAESGKPGWFVKLKRDSVHTAHVERMRVALAREAERIEPRPFNQLLDLTKYGKGRSLDDVRALPEYTRFLEARRNATKVAKLKAALVAHPALPLCEVCRLLGREPNGFYTQLRYLEERDGVDYSTGRPDGRSPYGATLPPRPQRAPAWGRRRTNQNTRA